MGAVSQYDIYKTKVYKDTLWIIPMYMYYELFLNVSSLPLIVYLCVYQSAGGAFQPNQIEITLVTCQTRAHIRKMVEDTAVQLDTTHLRKITAICVADPDQVMRDCAEEGEGVEGKEGMSLSQISDLG